MSSPYLVGRITHTTPAGPRGITLELDMRLSAQPGQFVMAWLPRLDEKPFSLLDDDPVTLMILRVGPFTERAQGLEVGDVLYLRGPFGNGFSLAGERPLLIGGGSGVAPLAFLAQRLRKDGWPVTLALGARTHGELLLCERFRSYGVDLALSTDDGSVGEHGLVTDVAARLLSSGQHDRVYACGPSPMLKRVAELCRMHGVEGELSWEAYMRCAIGVCGSCDHGDGRLVCRDGPVLPAW